MGRLSAIVLPMGDHKMGGEEEKEPESHDEGAEDGLRESFDEFADAAGIAEDSRDAAFEALKGLIEQCCAKY